MNTTKPSGGADTPYQRAGQVWDERLGTARAQVTRWQLACLGCLLVAALAVYGLIIQSRKAQVVAYAVEVSTDGQPRVVRPALEPYVPTKAAMQHQAREFIQAVRSLPTDVMVVRRQWLWAYGVVTDKGKHLLNAKVQEHNRANEVGTKIVHVEMQRCLPVSEQSFDLTWRETTYDPQGQPLQSTLYSGLISLVLRAPAHEKELWANPLGIWIDHFSWSAKE